jgi:hypothetical protein
MKASRRLTENVTSKIRLTMPRVKMSRADRNPWLAKMDQDKGKSLDPFQQTLLQSIEVLQRSVNIINIDQENIAKRLDDLDNRVQQTNFKLSFDNKTCKIGLQTVYMICKHCVQK